MKKYYFYLFLLLLVGCKKEPQTDLKIVEPKKVIVPPIVIKGDKSIPIDTALINTFKSKTLTEFYSASNNMTVWGNTKKRLYILECLENAGTLGLNPSDYHIKRLLGFENNFKKLTDDELTTYDLLLTQNFERYIVHLYEGKLNPKYLYNDWALEDKKLDINSTLVKCFNRNTIDSLVENIQPKSYTYKLLLKSLKLIDAFPDEQIKTIPFTEKIVRNDTSSSLITIKKKLIYWNDMIGNDSLSSIYDTKTFESIKRFQKRHGLLADGVIGAGTIEALNYSKQRRKQQIIANIERWRWYPQELAENYFIINIPDYNLQVVESKDTTASRNVVVGTAKRKTPVLTSTLKTIVFNPTWTVPPTILKEDIVPAMKVNRNYLKNKSITIYDSNGKEVDPLKWNENRPHSYRYVQSPGNNNSLGLMKILFPNNYSVYLHDTNHRSYFERSNRSLSSGCVRVENPLALAEHILKDTNKWNRPKIDSLIATQKTKSVKIDKNFKIYQWYWTAWCKDNKLQFRPDIYNLDDELYLKLRGKSR